MRSFIGRSIDLTAIEEQNKRKKKITFVVIISVVGIIVLLAIWYYWHKNREYEGYKVKKTISVKNGNSMEYVSYKGGLLRYDRDGVTVVDEKGTSTWGASYEMSNPSVDTCEESVVIADIGGTELYVRKETENGTEFSVDYPIVQAVVSKQGVVAVVTEEGVSNTISIYNPFDKSDKLLAEIPTNVEDGYPVSIDISNDGSSIVASYLCVTSGVVQSRVAFYNFSEVGKNANCLVGAKNYDETVVSEVKYISDESVCLFDEQGIHLWGNLKQPELTKAYKFKNDIQSAFIGEGYVGILLRKDDENCLLRVFDKEGEEALKKNVSSDFSKTAMANGQVILSATNKCEIYRLNGVRKFGKTLKEKVSYWFPTVKENCFYIIQDSKIKIIKLQ